MTLPPILICGTSSLKTYSTRACSRIFVVDMAFLPRATGVHNPGMEHCLTQSYICLKSLGALMLKSEETDRGGCIVCLSIFVRFLELIFFEYLVLTLS